MSDYEGMKISVKVVVGRNEAEFGPGTSRLLALIDECGSVRHAAEAMEMSDCKTWKIDAFAFDIKAILLKSICNNVCCNCTIKFSVCSSWHCNFNYS